MLDVKNLSIIIRDKKFVSDLSFSLKESEKLAIIGEEGDGKSTLAKVISGIETPYASVTGKVSSGRIKLVYLEQILPRAFREVEAWSYLFFENPLSQDEYVASSQAELVNVYLKKFKIGEELLSRKMKTLSGGENLKIRLIKVLSQNPDILVLDEPTNDLDIDSLVWLENFIKSSEKGIIFISHDETLLENCATAILHLERVKKKTECKVTIEHIGYREYVKKRDDLFLRQTMIAEKKEAQHKQKQERWKEIYEKVRKDLNSISRRDPSGGRLLKKKMKSVKAQQRRIEKEGEDIEKAPSREEAIFVQFEDGNLSNKRVIFEEKEMKLMAGERVLSKNINLRILGQDKAVIIGRNGVGKTTLLKFIAKKLEEKNISFSYMPQDYDNVLSSYETVKDFCFERAFSKEEQTKILTFLGSLKFTSEEVEGKITSLSGGQKAKLFLAVIMSRKADVLLLDEPTRNLSPLSCPIIREALKNYRGAVVAVSHDRKLIDVFDRVLNLTENGIEEL